MSNQDKNNSSDSSELDLSSNIDDETIFDSEVSKPDDDEEELEDPIDYFKKTFLSTYKLEHPDELINLLYLIQNNEYTGRSVGKIREMKVKFRRFVSLMNKISAGIKSKGNQFLSLKEYTTDKKSLDTIINYFNIVVNDDLNYSSDGFHSSPIKPPRKSQTPQANKGRRKRTSIHEPTPDSSKRRTPRRKRITPTDSDELLDTSFLEQEDSLPSISFNFPELEEEEEDNLSSLLLSPYDLVDDDIELLEQLGYNQPWIKVLPRCYEAAKKPQNKLDEQAKENVDALHQTLEIIRDKMKRNIDITNEQKSITGLSSFFRVFDTIINRKPIKGSDIIQPIKPPSIKPITDNNNNNFSSNKMDDDTTFIANEDDETELNETFQQYNERVKRPAKKVKFNQLNTFDESRFKKGSEFESPTSEEDIQRLLQQYKQEIKTTGKRENRDAPTVLSNIGKFGNLNIQSHTQNSSLYKQNFLDIIINGNYRVKYIPAAATRDQAKVYCHTHLDPDGKPKYRLLPTNAKDPSGEIEITDLNGDKVDDIILVDKRGVPQIINGYKLVFASPYKKVWKTMVTTPEERKRLPFNVWLDEMFEKSKEKIDWDTGKYILQDSSKTRLAPYIQYYSDLRLGKPRVSTRASPNSFWSSLFSKIWKVYWEIFSEIQPLSKVVNYLTISNALFVYHFDNPVKKAIETEHNLKPMNYVEWMNYRKTQKSDYNKKCIALIQDFINKSKKTIVFETGKWSRDIGNWNPEFKTIIENINYLIQKVAPAGTDVNETIAYIKIASPSDIQTLKEVSNNNIAIWIDTVYGKGCGYIEYKIQMSKQKIERLSAAEGYDIKVPE